MMRQQSVVSELAQRARRGARRYDVGGAAARAVQSPWRHLARDRNIVFVHSGCPEGVGLPTSISVARYESMADVPKSVLAEVATEAGENYDEVMTEEFARGGIFWTAIGQGRLVACQWSILGARLGRWFVELQPDDLVLHSAMTVPAFRGQGVAAGLSCCVIDREMDEGARAFIDCKQWNRSAIRFVAGAGFERIAVQRPRVPGVAARLPTPAPDTHLVAVTTQDAWYRDAAAFIDEDHRQSWAWGECSAERVGARSEHRALVRNGGDVKALVDVWVKGAGGVAGIAYVSGGPLVRHRSYGDDLGLAQDGLAAVLRALVADYVLGRHMVLRVVPSPADPSWIGAQERVFRTAGFTPTDRVPPRATIVVDLDTPPDRLRASFAQKWRNCLNYAERQGLAVRAGRAPELLDDFLPLFDELVARKGFVPGLPATFFAQVQHRLPEHARFHVALAEDAGSLVAGQVTAVVGDTAVYVLGASNEAGRRHKAAYLLQWDAMASAHRAGCRWYDLGGIDPVKNPDGYRFKRGMGGVEVAGAGPYEIRPPGFAGRITLASESAYRRFRDVRSRRA